MPNKERYMLEIYYPAGRDTLMAYFTSDTPFGAIGKGDIINATVLPDADRIGDIRVTSVEHILWQIEGNEVKHKICVYSELVDRD